MEKHGWIDYLLDLFFHTTGGDSNGVNVIAPEFYQKTAGVA